MLNALFSSRKGLAQAHAWGSALIKSGAISRIFNNKPIWAQLKITDRCNLRCAYCCEHNEENEHVNSATVIEWLKQCANLGVKHVEFIGGEPLLHPDIFTFLKSARELKMNTGLTTNGFKLNEEVAKSLLDGGISRLQLSIDCIEPNTITKKAYSVLKPQLKIVSKMDIWVHVNSVLTAETLPYAKELALLLFDLGIPVAFSPAHTHGKLSLDYPKKDMIDFFNWLTSMKSDGHPVNMPQFLIEYYKETITGKTVNWTCEGGCKAFYIDSSGQFCICSHKPSGMNFMEIDNKALKEFHRAKKGCEENCGVACMLTSSFPYNRLDYVLKCDLIPEWFSKGKPEFNIV